LFYSSSPLSIDLPLFIFSDLNIAEISPMSKLYRCAIESYQYLLIWNREESTNHMRDIESGKGWRGGINSKESPISLIFDKSKNLNIM